MANTVTLSPRTANEHTIAPIHDFVTRERETLYLRGISLCNAIFIPPRRQSSCHD